MILRATEEAMVMVGYVLLVLGQGALLVGAVGLGVYNGMLDFTDRRRSEGDHTGS